MTQSRFPAIYREPRFVLARLLEHPEAALTPAELAPILGVSRRTLRRWVAEGRIPHVRNDWAVVFPKAGVAAWLERRLSPDLVNKEVSGG